jgi:hypothetical protein
MIKKLNKKLTKQKILLDIHSVIFLDKFDGVLESVLSDLQESYVIK